MSKVSPFENMIIENNNFNVHDGLKHMTVSELEEYVNKRKRNFSLACLSVTGDLNVGIAIRSAHNMGADNVHIIGRRKYDKRTTVGAHNYTPVIRHGALNTDYTINTDAFVDIMDEYNLVPIFVETGEEELGSFDWNTKLDPIINEYKHQPCLVLGNEGTGIDQHILNTQDLFPHSFRVSIPQVGCIRSFNVSSAASIVMWDMIKECSFMK